MSSHTQILAMEFLSFLKLFSQSCFSLLHLLVTRVLPVILVLIASLSLSIYHYIVSLFTRPSSSQCTDCLDDLPQQDGDDFLSQSSTLEEPSDYLDDLPQQDDDDFSSESSTLEEPSDYLHDLPQQDEDEYSVAQHEYDDDDDLSSSLRREDWLNGVSGDGFSSSDAEDRDERSQEAEEAVHHLSSHNDWAEGSEYRPEFDGSREAEEPAHLFLADKGPAKASECRPESAASLADAELKPDEADGELNEPKPRTLPPTFSMIKRSVSRQTKKKVSFKEEAYDTSPGSTSSSSEEPQDASPSSRLRSSSEDKAASKAEADSFIAKFQEHFQLGGEKN